MGLKNMIQRFKDKREKQEEMRYSGLAMKAAKLKERSKVLKDYTTQQAKFNKLKSRERELSGRPSFETVTKKLVAAIKEVDNKLSSQVKSSTKRKTKRKKSRLVRPVPSTPKSEWKIREL